MTESFDFNDLTLIEIPVSVAGNNYVLREADEETAALYNNARIKGVPIKDSEVVGIPEDIGGMQSLLVSRCLFPLDSEGKPHPNPVHRNTVMKWPSRIVKPLFIKVKEISDLDDKEDLKSLRKQQSTISKKIEKLENEEEEEKNS